MRRSHNDIRKEIVDKATELNITPLFLLMSVAALCRNEAATEADVFVLYFETQLDEMMDEVKKKKQNEGNANKKMPDKEFVRLDEAVYDEASNPRYEAAALSNFVTEYEALYVHYLTWQNLISDREKAHRLIAQAKKYGYDLAYPDSVQIFKKLFPRLVSDFKESNTR